MSHFDLISGEKYGLKYRLVEIEDAEFIVKLRTSKRLSRYIHSTSNDVAKQVNWIESYKERERIGREYYYVFENNEKIRFGISRIHDIEVYKHRFSHGSWIFSPTAPFGVSILGDIIVREIGFEILELKEEFFDVRKKNINVLKYHRGYNPSVVKEDELNIYFRLVDEDFEAGKRQYLKILRNNSNATMLHK
jgi:hypothetical protein